ncbi:hypothetical protein BC834DRAFT_870964 [Gloeopeniophorella convolvens]|nr:hypothetical protein BC834DRAFT_870964 [Gloeopeniophorella convolvens]
MASEAYAAPPYSSDGYHPVDAATAGYVPTDAAAAGYAPVGASAAGYAPADAAAVGYAPANAATSGFPPADAAAAGHPEVGHPPAGATATDHAPVGAAVPDYSPADAASTTYAPGKVATANPGLADAPTYTSATSAYDQPTPPSWGNGKPSPLPYGRDRRNAPRVSRQQAARNAKPVISKEGHRRRFPFMKRQLPGHPDVVPVTVNMISTEGLAPSTDNSNVVSTAHAMIPTNSPHFAPGIKVDASQDALGYPATATSNAAATMEPPIDHAAGQHHPNLNAGGPMLHRDKVAAVASIISTVVGLIVLVTIVKLTSNAMRRRKHPVGLGRYKGHLSSQESLSDKMHFDTHDVIVTGPDGSEVSPTISSSGRNGSPSPLPFNLSVVDSNQPPLVPPFAPLSAPTSPLSLPYVQLLSPTVNLERQNLAQNRVSEASETMTVSTTTTDISERRSTSDDEGLGRQLSHRRMRSAPGSVVWSARSSSATGKFLSGASGEEGYWESVDVCSSESMSRMACRSSRTRSAAMSVMW